MKKLIGDVYYKRNIFCGYIGYTYDDVWVWIIKLKKDTITDVVTKNKIIPKNKLQVIGKLKIDSSSPLSKINNASKVLTVKLNAYPDLTENDIGRLETHNILQKAVSFKPYLL